MTDIVRMRRGRIRTEDRDADAEHLQRTGLADSAAVDGDLAAALHRDLGHGTTEVVRRAGGGRWRPSGDSRASERCLTGRDPFVTHVEVVG